MKMSAANDVAVVQLDFDEPAAPSLRTPLFSRRRMILEYRDVRFAQHLAEDVFGHVRLVIPGDRMAVARQLIMLADARVELQRVAADDFLLAEVGVSSGRPRPCRRDAGRVRSARS